MNDLRKIDSVDRKILRKLQKNFRISNHVLADSLHISDEACSKRVEALEGEGYILGYAVQLNPKVLDASLLVMTEVKLDATTPKALLCFKKEIELIEEVLECYLLTGHFDYLIKSRIKDLNCYKDFVGGFLANVHGIRNTRSYLVIEEVKNTTDLPIY